MDNETWQSGPKKPKMTIFKPLELEAQLSSKFMVISAPLPPDFMQFASARFILTCLNSCGFLRNEGSQNGAWCFLSEAGLLLSLPVYYKVFFLFIVIAVKLL